MKKLLLVLTILIFSTVASQAQVTPEYRESLKKMFQLSGTGQAYQGAIKQMFGMLKQTKKEVPEAVWSEFEKEFANTSLDDLVDMIAPVYMKYLNLDDLKKITEFYLTPVGKKFAAAMPLMTQESMEIGQAWGQKIGSSFVEKLKARGY